MKAGDSRRCSEAATVGSAKTAFGAVLAELVPAVHPLAVPLGTVETQPGGKAGAATPSKFCQLLVVALAATPPTNVW